MSNPEQHPSRLLREPRPDAPSNAHIRWLPLVAVVYFSLHVVARVIASPAVDFDESEQVFLSQWFAAGYNSQPPMYTWVQSVVFSLLGCSVFSLALLKNLFIGGTFVAIYATVRLATRDDRPAAVATFGTLTIPQIAWESHRDLAHTVAVTFCTVALVYAIVRLVRRPTWLGYAMIGVAAGFGMLFKYNFALMIVGVLVAAMSIPRYRERILDRRIALTVLVAIGLVTPHALWLEDHLRLASSKTLSTMHEQAHGGWLADVTAGSLALISCLLACLALTLFLFALFGFGDRGDRLRHGDGWLGRRIGWLGRRIGWLGRRGESPQIASTNDTNLRQHPEQDDWADQVELGALLGRTLSVVLGLLLLLILSGHATEFKNRWLQPFVVLAPALLAVTWPTLSRRYARSRIIASGYVVMATVLVAIVLRPILSDDGKKPNQLNTDFGRVADEIKEFPRVVVASNMRIAGNLRIRLPRTVILSEDHPHLGRGSIGPDDTVIFVSDRIHEPTLNRPILNRDTLHPSGPKGHATERLTKRRIAWRTVKVPCLRLPEGGEFATFHVGRFTSSPPHPRHGSGESSESVATGREKEPEPESGPETETSSVNVSARPETETSVR